MTASSQQCCEPVTRPVRTGVCRRSSAMMRRRPSCSRRAGCARSHPRSRVRAGPRRIARPTRSCARAVTPTNFYGLPTPAQSRPMRLHADDYLTTHAIDAPRRHAGLLGVPSAARPECRACHLRMGVTSEGKRRIRVGSPLRFHRPIGAARPGCRRATALPAQRTSRPAPAATPKTPASLATRRPAPRSRASTPVRTAETSPARPHVRPREPQPSRGA